MEPLLGICVVAIVLTPVLIWIVCEKPGASPIAKLAWQAIRMSDSEWERFSHRIAAKRNPYN